MQMYVQVHVGAGPTIPRSLHGTYHESESDDATTTVSVGFTSIIWQTLSVY